MVTYAHRLDSENGNSEDDDSLDNLSIIQDVMAFREHIRNADEQDENKAEDGYHDDPVSTPPEKKGHPPEPPLDPGGDTGDGIKVSNAKPDYKRLGMFC